MLHTFLASLIALFLQYKNIMKLRTSEIFVGERIRKKLGDLESLKRSIAKYGQLQPILVDGNKNLIAGFRRLEAIKQLGIEFVEIKVIDIRSTKEKLELEIEENRSRENFDVEEDILSTKKLLSVQEESFFSKIKQVLSMFSKK
ncbi:MAG: ParB N-terminal domain-containing protein [Leptospiraceae bacterium]|nr:ParB N-terminal domain-containing protein [Leptospiraceae bacterium]